MKIKPEDEIVEKVCEACYPGMWHDLDKENAQSALRTATCRAINIYEEMKPKEWSVRVETLKESNGRITHFVVAYQPGHRGTATFFDDGRMEVASFQSLDNAEVEAQCYREFLNVTGVPRHKVLSDAVAKLTKRRHEQ